MSVPHIDETLVAVCATKATELENVTCTHKHALGRRVGRREVMGTKRRAAPKTPIDPLFVGRGVTCCPASEQSCPNARAVSAASAQASSLQPHADLARGLEQTPPDGAHVGHDKSVVHTAREDVCDRTGTRTGCGPCAAVHGGIHSVKGSATSKSHTYRCTTPLCAVEQRRGRRAACGCVPGRSRPHVHAARYGSPVSTPLAAASRALGSCVPL